MLGMMTLPAACREPSSHLLLQRRQGTLQQRSDSLCEVLASTDVHALSQANVML